MTAIVCANCATMRRHVARGLCQPCYAAAWRAGTLDQHPAMARPAAADSTVHGTTRGWSWHRRRGERPCRACQAAQTRYGKWRRVRNNAGDPAHIDAAPVAVHVMQLRAAGMSARSIAAAAGIATSTVQRLLDRPGQVRAGTAARLLAVTGPPRRPANERDETFVPKIGTVRRIQALQALGWRHLDMRAACGIRTELVLAQPGAWVTVRTAAAVAGAYDRLSMRRGPSERTVRRAAAKGWVPPLAWDEDTIDDAYASPATGDPDPARDVIDLEEVDHLLTGGAHLEQIADRLGVTCSGIAKAAQRAGRIDLARLFNNARRDAS